MRVARGRSGSRGREVAVARTLTQGVRFISQVAEHVSPGGDVFVSICEGASASAAPAAAPSAPAPSPEAAGFSAAATPAAVDAPRAAGDKLAKKLKVYVHYEAAAASKDPTATSVCVVEDTAKSVGDVIKEFVGGKCATLFASARAPRGGRVVADWSLSACHRCLST